MKRTKYLSLILLCTAQTFAAGNLCNPKNGAPGWKVFVDRVHHFCFEYRPQYSRVHDPTPKRKSILSLRAEGDINIWLDDQPFSPQRLDELSRSGNSPEEQQINSLTFYYNGPGGGGVFYSDDYLFNLQGKILHIEFDGPYIDGSTPSEETKKLEPELLKTFQTF